LPVFLGVERNSWLSESSILMRSMPNTAPITIANRMMQDSTGVRMAIRPRRSSPKAMLIGRCSDFFASGSTVFLSSMPCPVLTSAQSV
jgi:hypothetical protein